MANSQCHVIVKPRSPRTEVYRTTGGILVRVTAPPVEGAANIAVIQALSAALGIPKSSLEIIAGAASRWKRVVAQGVSQEQLTLRIAKLPELK